MGRQSREKRERKEMDEVRPKERQEIRPIFILRGVILISALLILFTPLIGPPLTNLFFFPFVGPKSLYFMALAEIMFFSWLLLNVLDRRFRPKFNLILFGIVLFIAVSAAASINGIDPILSFWSKFERMAGILMLLHLLAFFLVISSTFKKNDWEKIFVVSIFTGVVISIISLLFKDPMNRGGATIGNDSFLGTYLLFNLFFALYLFFRSLKNLSFAGLISKIYSSVCFAIMFFTLFFGGARAAKLSFLGGAVLLFFLWLAFSKRGRLKAVGIFLLLLSLISGFLFSFLAFQPESFVRKGIIERAVGETFGGRFIVWEEGWQSFLQRPLLGWGPENFEFAFTKNYNSCMGIERCGTDMWYDRAHNIIFDTLVTSGTLGIISYIFIFLFAFYFLWRSYFQKKNNFWLAGIFTVLLISYFIQNLTVFDMVASYMIFFLSLGFIAKKEIPAAEISHQKSLLVFPAAILITSLFLFSFFKFVIFPLQADAYSISAIRAKPFSDEKLSLYKKALSVSPVGRYQIREFFVDSTVNSMSEKIPKENMIRELDFIKEEMEKSIKGNEVNYRAHLKLSQLLNVYARIEPSKLEEAEKILNKAIEISPANQQGYWNLAQTKIQQGKIEEALSLAEKAMEMEPKLETGHTILIKIAVWMGKRDLAETKLNEALSINPNWEKDLKELLPQQK